MLTASTRTTDVTDTGGAVIVPVASARGAGGGAEGTLAPVLLAETRASPGRWAGGRGILPMALALSLALHVGLLAFAVSRTADDRIGSGGVEIEAIGIEIVTSDALESLVAPKASSSVGAMAIVEAPLSEPPPPPPAPPPSERVSAPAPTAPAEALAAVDTDAPDDADLTGAAIVSARPRRGTPDQAEPRKEDEPPVSIEPAKEPRDEVPERVERKAMSSKPAAEPLPPPPPPTAVPEAAASIARVTPPETSPSPAATAAATAGAAARYAIEVRMALGRQRPRHQRMRGRVTVSFVIAVDGSIERVEVAASSGNSQVDAAALASVRSASFPRPPTGLTKLQRHYLVPFVFK